jgi:ABC-type histidine transport system ATPase subunit
MKDAEMRIAVTGLEKSFGDVRVLDGIFLSARQGEVVSILGASGSGKSTFLRCLNFLETADAGTITIRGDSVILGQGTIAEETKRKLRRHTGFVFQSFNLWSHLTVIENVMQGPVHVMGRKPVDARERAEALLARVGVLERSNYYPAQLSGGQQQRVAIARALALDPDVLLFDEPTSALDPELVGEVLKVMRNLADEGRTMLVVTHEMSFAREVSSKVVFMHKGKIDMELPPAEAFGAGKTERFTQFLANTRH